MPTDATEYALETRVEEIIHEHVRRSGFGANQITEVRRIPDDGDRLTLTSPPRKRGPRATGTALPTLDARLRGHDERRRPRPVS